MHDQGAKINVDILIKQGNKALLGKVTKQWRGNHEVLYGIPGREIHFKETLGECIKRSLKEDLDCDVTFYQIISVNANYEYGNHFIGIGVLAEIKGEPKVANPQAWET